MVNKLSLFGRRFGRGIGSVAKKELVGKVAKSKEGINSEGQSEEALVEEPFYPVTGAMACVFWVALMTMQLVSLSLQVDQFNWGGFRGRSSGGAGRGSVFDINGQQRDRRTGLGGRLVKGIWKETDANISRTKGCGGYASFHGDSRGVCNQASRDAKSLEDVIETVSGGVVDGGLDDLGAAEVVVSKGIKDVFEAKRTESVRSCRQASQWEAEFSLQEGLEGEIAQAVVWVLAMV